MLVMIHQEERWMYLATLAFLLGIMSLQWFRALPSGFEVAIFLLLAGVGWRFLPKPFHKIMQVCVFFGLGMALSTFRAHQILSWTLPSVWENQIITVLGVITSLPKTHQNQTSFDFQLQKIEGQAQNAKIRLTWQQVGNPSLHVGELWQLQVKLKKPHGLRNPGGFDYEKLLFMQGIRATGSVKNSKKNHCLGHFHGHYFLSHFRETLEQKITTLLKNSDVKTVGLILALVMGAQHEITEAQWQTMRLTGTNHLMAIAGVHIAFISGLFYGLVNFLWRRLGNLALYFPAQKAGIVASLIVAVMYSALAGFSLPAQRALMVLALLSYGLLTHRTFSSWNLWSLALMMVLIFNPLAVLGISFWLSFGAVGFILYGLNHRLKAEGLWWKYGRVQWVVTLGLIPISLWLFQQASLISFFANLIAVPAVGLLILPLSLMGAMLLFVIPMLGKWLLLLAAIGIHWIWRLLETLGSIKWAVWQQAIPNGWVFVALMLGVLILLLPRGFPGRWLGIFFFLPLCWGKIESPIFKTIWFTLLDVGQGLSAVVQTKQHVLVFDTGPPLGQDNAGERVLIPFLRARGIHEIDTLIISHGDSDHHGGTQSLLEKMPVKQILTSCLECFVSGCSVGQYANKTNKICVGNIPVQACEAGQRWWWDGVSFRVLNPDLKNLPTGNNASCVLKIGPDSGGILLTGDIEKPAEYDLLKRVKKRLASAVLVVPHHGSRTSSTSAFIDAVKATYVLFSVGYLNRFHFPNLKVVQRFDRTKAKLLETAGSGAIQLKLNGQGEVVDLQEYRKKAHQFWH